MRSRLLLLTALVSATGCVTGNWAVGLPDDGPLPQGSVPNGVVLITGPSTWQEVAQLTTVGWDVLLPEGVAFDSVDPQASAGQHAMLSEAPPAWQGAVLWPGHVALDVSPLGLLLDIDVTLEPVEVILELNGQPACYLEVEIFEGRLEGTLALTRSKLGVVNLSPLSEATFREGDAEVTMSTCHDDLLGQRGTPSGPEARALAALASAAFDALAPSIASAVPSRLGLNLAGATTIFYEDGGLGAGSQHTVIRAPLDGPSPWWQLASGRLIVPYSVGVTAASHPCVPTAELPVAMSAPVPTIDSDWALLVNQGVVAQHMAALWSAGGLCGDRLASAATWMASEWLGGWPALGALDPSMALSVRVWPGSSPGISFRTGDGGAGVQITIDQGAWHIDLMGWRDGARVRLATLRASIALEADLSVGDDGAIWLTPGVVAVDLLGTSAGLLSPPDQEGSVKTLEAIVRGVVESSPLSGMLSLPQGLQPLIELHGEYIVIRDP
jgi:hypothetical protein